MCTAHLEDQLFQAERWSCLMHLPIQWYLQTNILEADVDVRLPPNANVSTPGQQSLRHSEARDSESINKQHMFKINKKERN